MFDELMKGEREEKEKRDGEREEGKKVGRKKEKEDWVITLGWWIYFRCEGFLFYVEELNFILLIFGNYIYKNCILERLKKSLGIEWFEEKLGRKFL